MWYKKTHSVVAHVPLFCFYPILTSSVIYYWTDALQHRIHFLSVFSIEILNFIWTLSIYSLSVICWYMLSGELHVCLLPHFDIFFLTFSKPRAILNKTKTNKFSMTSSMCLYPNRSWAMTNQSVCTRLLPNGSPGARGSCDLPSGNQNFKQGARMDG